MAEQYDLGDMFGILWKLGAGALLIVGFGRLVNRDESSLEVSAIDNTFLRDSVTGIATVGLRYTAKGGNIWLTGCPQTPVVLVEQKLSGGWGNQRQLNHWCTGAEKGTPVATTEGTSDTTFIEIREVGRYRASVPWGTKWGWTTFNVR